MFMVWIGALLVALKWFEVDPIASLSWLWVLTPLGIAFVWFEIFERLFLARIRAAGADEEDARRSRRFNS